MSIFNDSKYFKWYCTLVQVHAEPRKKVQGRYTEKHHNIPRSLGGTNDSSNIVRLSARAHYVAHLLLIRAVLPRFRPAMIAAARAMAMNAKKRDLHRKMNSLLFKRIREEHAKWLSETKWFNDGVKSFRVLPVEAVGLTPGRLPLPSRSGVVAITDGSQTKRVKVSDPIPDGWYLGGSPKNKTIWASTGEEARKRGTALGKTWVNNGVMNKLVKAIEAGWVPGRLTIGKFDPKLIRSLRGLEPPIRDAQSLAE